MNVTMTSQNIVYKIYVSCDKVNFWDGYGILYTKPQFHAITACELAVNSE